MAPKTQVTKEGLIVPVFDGSYNNSKGNNVGRLLAEPKRFANTLLQQMFEPEELESLILVNIDNKKPEPHHLRPRTFDDGEKRQLAFSSGNSYFLANDELRAKIGELFATEKDTACRYGSLLTSECLKGLETLENLRIKIVDFTEPLTDGKGNIQKDSEGNIQYKYAEYQTGDCHGKISPRVAVILGGERNRPLQFRFAWRKDWAEEETDNSLPSFLAKGTLLPDRYLTEDKGYDIIMDRSSIKGINKDLLQETVPCGDYEFPLVVMGNRGNAKETEYDSSWQFAIWYSEEALKKDVVPATREKAEELANLQRNPLALAKFIVEEYDRKQARAAEQAENELTTDESDDEKQDKGKEKQELRMITLLRNDEFGQMIDSPIVAEFMRNYVANRWRDLAIKGGINYDSGMAQPAQASHQNPERGLNRGEVCVPHLPEGDTIITRYPIVSGDNIRIYTNVHKPALTKHKGTVWIRPEDAEEYHQADFDGDQMVAIVAAKVPNIAAETLRAGEPSRHAAVKKRTKVAYTAALDEDGNRKYTKLSQIAAHSSQNKIGLVATTIGRVQSSIPNNSENPRLFERKRERLLNRLFDALQVEVDSPKSATRLEDVDEIDGKNLLKDAQKWSEKHPSHFFDFKKDERLYKTFPMPADDPNPINVIAREAVNPCWEATRIRNRERHEFRYLFPKDSYALDEEEYAIELKERARSSISDIKKRVGDDRKAFNEELGKFYEGLRTEIEELFPTTEERFPIAMALGNILHTKPDLDKHRQESAELAENLKVTFALEPEYELLHEALPRETYVLQVPFKKTKGGIELLISERFASKLESADIQYEKKGKRLIVSSQETDALDELGIKYKKQDKLVELANVWKDRLDIKGISYEAIAHPELPLVEFAFKELHPQIVENLENKYGQNYNDPDKIKIPDNLVVVPPADCGWVESRNEPGKASLVYNLFMDEVVQAIKQTEIDQIKVLGIRHNEYAQEDFSLQKWRNKEVTVEVGIIDHLPRTHPDYYRLNGAPILEIDGKNLGTFAPDTPKLPIGTTMTATLEPNGSTVILHIDPESIRLPQLTEKISLSSTSTQPTASSLQSDMQDLLVEAVQKYHEGSKQEQFKLGNDRWTAYVDPDGSFLVKNESKRTVCRGNYKTNEMLLPLKEEAAAQLQEMIAQREEELLQSLDTSSLKPIKKRQQIEA